ncbi:beta-N-acetylhexosaminidase [Albibacterium indicum]|uniref:beta-N-acetylhexosaminidase n=1 Tax=Albibacterium indicum TaxID=2292082 RepID=UPI001FE4AA60|nr:family 20 glycosylhydrolase [Pedobacter indicus]
MRSFLIVCLILLFIVPLANAQEVSIIPEPVNLELKTGTFTIDKKTKIVYEKGNVDLRAIGEKLSDQIKELTGFQLEVTDGGQNDAQQNIYLSLNKKSDTLGNEGYSLDVDKNGIQAKANKEAGIFYAAQTIYQLIPTDKEKDAQLSSVTVPAVEISDYPRFGWRGLMLDVGRYFYSVDFIKEYIDNIAMHKMNTFHWHLTEDHGWRIEIKQYPKLIEIGAWRDGTQFSRFQGDINKNPHGGFYTQDQIREVVKYAQERYITIIPEIEMPGHATAALSAYPELSCTGGPFIIPDHWGIQKEIFCAGNEQTFEFLENVLAEVADLFPSPIIHIGGDEAPKDRWKACAKCQKRIKDENLKDEHELQSYFITRIEKFVNSKGKKIIGWDEILEGGLAPNAMVMSWRGEKGGIAAAKLKHEVIMAPNTYAYFDYHQGEHDLEPRGFGNLLTLEKVYSYEPRHESFTDEEAGYIKGVQGNVWAEFIHTPEKVQYFAFPRAAALAEIAWSPSSKKDWESFQKRIEDQYKRYELAGMNYSTSAYDVWIDSSIDSIGGIANVSLSTQSYQPEIRYTVDGSEPTNESPVYQQAITIPLPGTVKAATFRDGKRISDRSARSFFIKPTTD